MRLNLTVDSTIVHDSPLFTVETNKGPTIRKVMGGR